LVTVAVDEAEAEAEAEAEEDGEEERHAEEEAMTIIKITRTFPPPFSSPVRTLPKQDSAITITVNLRMSSDSME
jgi:hypothetical protein